MVFENLKPSPLWPAFSNCGRDIIQPPDIFYWTGRAKKEAEINGTIGELVGPENEFLNNGSSKVVTFYVPAIKDFVSTDPADVIQYAPVCGLPDLRKHWLNWIVQKGKNANNLPSGKPDLTGKLSSPAIVPGITFGIFMAAKLFVSPGEIIISPNKRWGNYDAIIVKNVGGTVSSFEMFTADGIFNFKGMSDKIQESFDKQGKAVIILNFPNNPTGYSPSKAETAKMVTSLKEIAQKNKKPIVIICDDAYEGYVYDDVSVSVSPFYELVGVDENLIPIKLDGASKEMLMYGGRVGAFTLGLNEKWFTPDTKAKFLEEFENKVEALIRATVSNSNRSAQTILIKMFEQGIQKVMESRQKVIAVVRKRYDLINKLLKEAKLKGVTIDPNAGGFFLFMNLDKKINGVDFNEHLLKKYKMCFIPIVKEKEGINGIRIAYCSVPEPLIPKLVENLKLAMTDFKL